MTTNVDVLKVMDETSDALRAEDYIYLAIPLEEARAAVAELIDKVDSYVTLGDSDTSYRELSAALARVKGA